MPSQDSTPIASPGRPSPSGDRYGGHRFEFRAVGSTQNVSMVNTVLCTAIAEFFEEMTAKMMEGEKELEVAAKMLRPQTDELRNSSPKLTNWTAVFSSFF